MLLVNPRIYSKGIAEGIIVKRCSPGGCPSARQIDVGSGHECKILHMIVRKDIPKYHPDRKCPLPKT